MRIWDLHCHPDGERVPGRTLMEKVENMLEIAGRMGIERCCMFLRVGQGVDEKEALQVLTRYPDKLFGFVWLSLWNNAPKENIDKLNRWIADGPMIGMKTAGSDGVCSVRAYDPVFERAAQLKALVYIHAWYKTGAGLLNPNAGQVTRIPPSLPGGLYTPNESTPRDVAELASRRPETPLICGHTGGDWELGIRAVRAARNVLIGIGGSFPTRGMVEMAVRELGADRIIYGSDIAGRSFSSQLAKVHGAPISDKDKELIFSGNLHRIMTPILQAKGIAIKG
ncbi:MAG: amidohydrolase family protein [Bryobacteraceae bacterium]|nr:amidohydrolase family protein [Bryobacteraceae bacterium]